MDKEAEPIVTEQKPADQQNEEYEFMIPLNTLVKTKPFVDRYFVKYYKVFSHPTEVNLVCNQYAFMHTNKLFMIGIAKEHSLIIDKLGFKGVSYDCLMKGNDLKVKGKKKKGGAKVRTNTKICEIYTEKGITFDVYGLVEGNLIEINDKLEEHPEYLLESPESKGYLAIVNSGLYVDKYLEKLTPEDQYRASLKSN